MKRIKGKNIDKRSKEHISEERNQEILTIICQKRMSVREAAKRFNLARSTIFDWKKASMEGKPLSNRGRPKIVDDKGLEYIKETVKNCYHANSTTPAGKTTVDGQHNVESIISQAICDTSKRNNRPKQGDSIDRKTRNSILDEAGLQIVRTEDTTGFRALGC